MSDVQCRAAGCRSVTDAYLCRPCTATLEQALAELPALADDLDVTITRQARGTATPPPAHRRPPVAAPAAEPSRLPARLRSVHGPIALPATAWPFAPSPADLRWAVENTLTTWTRHISAAHNMPAPPPTRVLRRYLAINRNRMTLMAETGPVEPLRAAAGWLLSHLDAIRTDQAAAQIHDEITSTTDAITSTIDRQEPDIFAGRCAATDVTVTLTDGLLATTIGVCGNDLYANLDDTEVTCECGSVYDLKTHRASMADKVNDRWARPHLIADALTTLDEPVNASTLRTWIERDAKLAARLRARGGDPAHPLVLQVGIDDDGHALYRVGDVRARIAAMKAAKTERITA